jgi:CHAD domain-containing protein
LDTLRSDRDRRRTPLLEALRSDRYTALLDSLVRGAQRPRLLLRIDDEPDSDILRRLVTRPWTHLRDAVEALGDEPPDAELHATRIRIKRARYAAEAVEAAFGKPARAFARALTEAQDVLGEHQDAVIAAEWLRRTAARENDESVGFAAGQLAAFEHVNALAARATWPEAWKRASKGRLRDWL